MDAQKIAIIGSGLGIGIRMGYELLNSISIWNDMMLSEPFIAVRQPEFFEVTDPYYKRKNYRSPNVNRALHRQSVNRGK